jgi:hypothetical protein
MPCTLPEEIEMETKQALQAVKEWAERRIKEEEREHSQDGWHAWSADVHRARVESYREVIAHIEEQLSGLEEA